MIIDVVREKNGNSLNILLTDEDIEKLKIICPNITFTVNHDNLSSESKKYPPTFFENLYKTYVSDEKNKFDIKQLNSQYKIRRFSNVF